MPTRLTCFQPTEIDVATHICESCAAPLVLGQCAIRRMTSDVFHVTCLTHVLESDTIDLSKTDTFHLFQSHLIDDKATQTALILALGPRLLDSAKRKVKSTSASASTSASTAASIAASASASDSSTVEQTVTPWNVKSNSTHGVDYERLVRDFGSTRITEELLVRFQRITGQVPHAWLRRGIFFSHRDLDKMLDLYERGEPFYLYTGRGPSSDALHLGHLVPFLFCAWLQRAFKVPIVVQVGGGNTRTTRLHRVHRFPPFNPTNQIT
jgi:hypothetical protein